MKTKLLSALLFVYILCSCSPDHKEIIEPEQPPIDNPEQPEEPEQPNKPEEPEEPQKPEEPAPIKGIININNEYMAVGNRDWYAITYGNGKYVAVGYGMNTTTSTDGENWTTPKAIQSSNYRLFSVAYGNGKYITFNELGHLSTSTDGINWTTPRVPISGMKSDAKVIFIDGRFIGVANFNDYNGHAIYSTNGEDWVHYKIGNGDFDVIMYGKGIYVAVSAIGNVYTSTDGENWTKSTQSLSPQMTWLDGAFGNGKFVVINGGTGNKHIAISSDGENWTIKAVGSSFFKCIAFGDGKFIATNYYREVYTSIDGENWTQLKNLPFEANDIIFVQ